MSCGKLILWRGESYVKILVSAVALEAYGPSSPPRYILHTYANLTCYEDGGWPHVCEGWYPKMIRDHLSIIRAGCFQALYLKSASVPEKTRVCTPDAGICTVSRPCACFGAFLGYQSVFQARLDPICTSRLPILPTPPNKGVLGLKSGGIRHLLA